MCWTHHAQDTRRRQTKHKTQHNMCWTHHAQDTRRRQIKHNTICVGHNYAQDTRRRKTKHNTTRYVLDTTIHKTQDEDK